MSRLALSFLGAFQATLDGVAIPFRSVKARALLAYLAIESERPHRRKILTTLLWPEESERVANNNFRQTLSSLRKVIGDREEAKNPVLLVTRETVQFNLASACWLDVRAMKELVQDASQGTSLSMLTEAVSLYRGDFLEGFFVRDSVAFEDWALLIRDRLQRQVAIVLQRLVETNMDQRNYEQACVYAWRWVELEPWREDAYQHLMRVLTLNGQRTAALAQYEVCRTVLGQEFSVEPSEQTVHLFEQIRDGNLTLPITSAQIFHTSTPLPSLETELPVFVAREAELGQLEAFLHTALDGRGQVIFVTGEAGQGKTLLLQAFTERARAQWPQLIVVKGNCNAYTGIGDPYLPFREMMVALTGAAITSARHARSVFSLVVQTLLSDGPDLVNIFVPGASLLGRATALECDHELVDRLRVLVERKSTVPEGGSPHQEDLFNQYTSVVQNLARQTPLVLLIDDMQWADLGSISLLFHLGRKLENSRILVIGAYRSEEVALGRDGERHPLAPLVNEFKRAWGDIEVPLDQAEGLIFVQELLASEHHCLDEDFGLTLYRQTRGHPLFTVELLRGMQERGDLIRDAEGRWMQGLTLNWGILPARVEAVIAERIERLPRALKQILRVASVEGEVFTAKIAAQMQTGDELSIVASLSNELDQRHRLVRAQGIEQVAGQRLSRYRFRHILFQTYLYNSLDAVERARLHEKVGSALLGLYGEEAQVVAPQLAWHFEQAGMISEAVEYYQLAGERAIRMSANVEAIAHLSRGLTLLDTLPHSPERDERELVLQLAITIPFTALKSWSATETIRACDRAMELSKTLNNTQQLLQSMLLQQWAHSTRAEHRAALAVAEKRYNLIQRLKDPVHILLGHTGLSFTCMFVGQFTRSLHHLEKVLALYDINVYRPLASTMGIDPGIGALSISLYTFWYLGYPDQALKKSQEGLALARELDHPFAMQFLLNFKGRLHRWRREVKDVHQIAETEMKLWHDHKIELAKANALLEQAWVLSEQGHPNEAISIYQKGLSLWSEIGMRNHHTEWLSVLANMYSKAKQPEQALDLIEEALDFLHQSEERYHEAELYRQRGLLRLQLNKKHFDIAETDFHKAITTARRMEAKMCELRATVSLCRQWKQQDKREQAREKLEEIYSWFTEGFGTRDLQEAKALLTTLDKTK